MCAKLIRCASFTDCSLTSLLAILCLHPSNSGLNSRLHQRTFGATMTWHSWPHISFVRHLKEWTFLFRRHHHRARINGTR
ncbi:hypothetical protein F5887DRAFT_78660 [Amanita rubescens]|nr:hypothetical protein F5887DRAFT_78660 [Amanita rubescens]